MGALRAAGAMLAAFVAGVLASPPAAGQASGALRVPLALAALAGGAALLWRRTPRTPAAPPLATLEHELRTPLASIALHLDALAAGAPGDVLAAIRRNVDHALALLAGTRGRVEEPAQRPALETCAVGALARDAAAMVRELAARKGLRLEVTCRAGVPDAIRTDTLRLRQILLNLLTNAVEATARGSVWLEVSAAAGPSPTLRFAVHDTGAGIAAGELERIFLPRVRGAEASPDPRRGLGLAIARELAHGLGGEISVRSTLGAGSTFTLALPATPRAAAEATATLPDPGGATAAAPAPALGGRVLLAEDAADVRELLAAALARAGAEVDAVASGTDALERVLASARLRRGYDLVLLDGQLPGLGGETVARRLRAAGCETPIVAITADPAAAAGLEAAGCVEVLVKPVPLATLLAAAGRHLRPATDAAAPAVQGASELVARFVELLAERLRDLEQAVAAGDLPAVCRLAHRLRGAAGSYGFSPVSEAATALEDAARAGHDLQAPLARLARRCERARAAQAVPAVAQSASSAR